MVFKMLLECKCWVSLFNIFFVENEGCFFEGGWFECYFDWLGWWVFIFIYLGYS